MATTKAGAAPLVARPLPPAEFVSDDGLADAMCSGIHFLPAPEVVGWLREAFLTEGGKLYNPEHAHLKQARIGALWANKANRRQMRRVVGMAEIPNAQGNAWAKARASQQVIEWFGEEVDFLLTFDAVYCAQASDVEWCALVEHELYHCAQETDGFGQPKFTKDGLPKFAMKGHDVEEFVGVVRRYGAVSPEVQALVEAAKKAPEIAAVHVAQMCGTCLLRAA